MNKNAYTKIAPFTIAFMIIATVVTSILVTIPDTVKAEGADTIYTIWLSTDPQIASVRAQYNYTYWNDSVCDANNVTVNISFCIGDQINGYPDASPSTWSECIWAWERFYEYFDTLNTDIYKNVSVGNHDMMPCTDVNNCDDFEHSWKNHSRIDNVTYPYGNYTWEWGNILFVVLAVENQNDTPVGATQWYTNQTEWFNDTVTGNSDKNILVISHLPIRDTVNPANEIPMDTQSSNAFKSTIDANDNVRGWFNGHYHIDQQGCVFLYENCTCIDCDSTNGYGTRSSVFLYIQEGNATVEAKAYNHATDAFAVIGNLPTTFTLKYNFSASGPENTTPILSTPNPSNETTAVSLSQITWNISINDTEGDTFNWTIDAYPNIGSGSANGASNGTKEITINPLTNTTHTIYVNVTDLGTGNWTNETFWFTTESLPTINLINSGPNNSVSINVYRNLNWYKVNNTICYQLQIANDTGFTDLLYNVSDINSTTYGAEYYHEVGNNVYFNITNIFHNEIYVAGLTHYYRVRACR